MACTKRRQFIPDFKVKVAIEAIKERETLSQVVQKRNLQPAQVIKWKKECKDSMSSVFENSKKDDKRE